MRGIRCGIPLLAGAVVVAGCGGVEPVPPEFAPKNQAACEIGKSRARPLIVEWPAADRASLEAKARRGIVAVRYDGCAMELLPSCKVAGGYGYVGLTRKQDHIAIKSFDELYTNIPTHALDFEGKLKASGRLDVTMTIVGEYEANKSQVRFEELDGSCDGATHYVSALTAGAFQFSAGAERDIGAGATLPVGGLRGGRTASRELLNEDGDESACRRATRADHEPPDGCGALLRIEVMPVVGAPRAAPRAATAGHATPTSHEAGPARVGPAAAGPERVVSCPGEMAAIRGGRMLLTTPREAPVGLVLDGAPGAARWVDVGGLCIDKRLVSSGDYARCVRAGNCSAEELRCGSGANYASLTGPINCVAWADAENYCRREGKRLPTEEEWEWVARGGSLAWPEPWGERAFQKPGSIREVEYSTFSTPDNVETLVGGYWQWTASAPASGSHVLRGGAFAETSPEAFVVRSSRTTRPDATRQPSYAFRCVK